MRSIDELDVQGAGCWCGSTSTFRWQRRRWQRRRRRHPHQGGARHDRGAARPGRAADPGLAPRPPGGQARGGPVAGARRGPPARADRRAGDARAGRGGREVRALSRAARRRRDRWCSRTSASSRARRPTTPSWHAALADLADVYVNDAFGAAHRAHASTEGVAHLLPSAAGRLLEREVRTMRGDPREPARPLVAVVGGAKVADKIARHRPLPGGRRRGDRRWRDVLPVPVRPGPCGRRLAVRRGGRRARPPSAREAAATRARRASSCPSDLVIARSLRGRRRAPCAGRGRGARAAGWASTSARARAERYAERDRAGGLGLLERADGGVRDGALRGRHPAGRRGGRRAPRA